MTHYDDLKHWLRERQAEILFAVHLDILEGVMRRALESSRESLPRLVKRHRVVCAWCKTVKSEGAEPTSHGICRTCLGTIEV